MAGGGAAASGMAAWTSAGISVDVKGPPRSHRPLSSVFLAPRLPGTVSLHYHHPPNLGAQTL